MKARDDRVRVEVSTPIGLYSEFKALVKTVQYTDRKRQRLTVAKAIRGLMWMLVTKEIKISDVMKATYCNEEIK